MKTILLSIFCLTSTLFLQAQNVSTLLNNPTQKVTDDMILDDDGNLYGSDYTGTSIYKITPQGVVSTFATGFNTPNGLAFDSQNNLFVGDIYSHRIYKLSSTGTFLDTFFVNTPSGLIKMNGSDTILFTQYQLNQISRLAPDGNISPMYTGAPMNGPVGLTYDPAGTLYIGNFNNRQVHKFENDSMKYIATMPGPAGGWQGFIVYARGILWGTGYTDNKIYTIYPNYVDSTRLFAGSVAGNTDGPVGIATFNAPNGIIPSITGDSIYISDYNSGRIRVITDFILAINEQTVKSSIKLYPNPFTDKIHIEIKDESIKNIKLVDLSGKLIQTFSAASQLSLGHLIQGVYILEIRTNRSSYFQKIQKF